MHAASPPSTQHRCQINVLIPLIAAAPVKTHRSARAVGAPEMAVARASAHAAAVVGRAFAG
jgi:hypothetical protein